MIKNSVNRLFCAAALSLAVFGVSGVGQNVTAQGTRTAPPRPAGASAAAPQNTARAAARPEVQVQAKQENGLSSLVDQKEQQLSADQDSLHSIPEVQEGLKLLDENKRDEAAAKFVEAYKKRPDLPPAGAALAVALFNNKQFDQVRYWLERTVDDCPSDPEVYIILAEVARMEGRLLEARLLANQGLGLCAKYEANPERRSKLALRGQLVRVMVSEAKQEWPEARQRLEQMIAQNPEEAEYYTRLGVVCFQMDDMKTALECFTRAIEKGAPLPPPQALAAILLEQKGKTNEAKQYLNAAIKADVNNYEVLMVGAQLSLKWELIEEARKLADRAAKIKKDSLDAQALCGLIAAYEKKYEIAQQHYEAILKENPNHFVARNGLALALCEQDDPAQIQKAVAFALQNFQANQQSMDAISTYAWTLFKAGQVDQAENIFKQLQAKTGVITPMIAYYLAEINSARGQTDQAKAFANAALETTGNYPKKVATRELLQQLNR